MEVTKSNFTVSHRNRYSINLIERTLVLDTFGNEHFWSWNLSFVVPSNYELPLVRAVTIGDFFFKFGNCFPGFHEKKRGRCYRARVATQRTRHPNYYYTRYTAKVKLCTQRLCYCRWETIPIHEKVTVRVAGRKIR